MMNAEQSRLTKLTQALTLPVDDAAHQRVLDRLDDYVASQLADEDYTTRFPEIALHLDACVECAEAYNLLYELALVEASNALHQAANAPEPDLAFLQPAGPTLGERVRAALQQVGEQLRLQLTPDLLPSLRPPLVAATTRGPADDQLYSDALLRLDANAAPDAAWPVALAVYRDAQDPAYCLVEVTVEPPDRTWPDLDGIDITLTVGETDRHAKTDAWGLVSFADVPVAALGEMAVAVTGM